MKTCTVCKIEKDSLSFNRSAGRHDGRQCCCRDCEKERYQKRKDRKKATSRAYYKANKEAQVALVIAYRKDHPEMVSATRKSMRKKYPEKEQARRAVKYAVDSGKMARPECCSICGGGGRIEGHHKSYEREHWLDVVWLCTQCHAKAHY